MIRLFDFADRQVDAIVAEGQEIIQKAVEGGLVGDVDFHRITAFSADAITIWCGEVEQAIQHFSPDAIVVFAGAARFLAGDPITMTKEGIASVAAAAPDSRVGSPHGDVESLPVVAQRTAGVFGRAQTARTRPRAE